MKVDLLFVAVCAVGIILVALLIVLGVETFIKPKNDAQTPPPRPALLPDGASLSWTVNDRDQWAAFLKSSTGRRLESRLRAMQADAAIRACRDDDNTVYSAARARGYEDCVSHMLSLAHAAEKPETPESTEPTDDTEAAMIARLSP